MSRQFQPMPLLKRAAPFDDPERCAVLEFPYQSLVRVWLMSNNESPANRVLRDRMLMVVLCRRRFSFDESVLMPADFEAIDSRVRSCGPRLEHVTFSLSCGFVPQSTSKRGEPGFMTG